MDIQLDPYNYSMNEDLVALAIRILSDVTGAEPDEGGALEYYDNLYGDDRWTAEVVIGLLELIDAIGPLRSGEFLVEFIREAAEALDGSSIVD